MPLNNRQITLIKNYLNQTNFNSNKRIKNIPERNWQSSQNGRELSNAMMNTFMTVGYFKKKYSNQTNKPVKKGWFS